MANEKETVLTLEGLAKLEKELEYLKTVRRREVAERIKQAIEFGDISENSEYEDAKNEQGFIEGRILSLEKMLRNAKVIDDEEVQTDKVSLGSKVCITDLETNEELVYTIVGSAEADPSAQRISNESPVGKALLGKGIKEIVEIDVPVGILRYRIDRIER
ncbi:MAG TPA: transcription elongation factor GreA [Firmicutes bacterium]|jgi:transcription elongation factor GreA|nr:transcription elongation factor GreA [Bacillota bacterium]